MVEMQQEANAEDVREAARSQINRRLGMVRTFDFMLSIMGNNCSVLNREGNLF